MSGISKENLFPVSCVVCKLIFRGACGLSVHVWQVHHIPGKYSHQRKWAKNYRSRNLPAIREKAKRYYRENKERVLGVRKNKIDRLRDEVFSAYGNKCACCGETIREFLGIDHVFNDGAEERRTLIATEGKKKMTGWSFYYYLKRQGFPKDRYQLYCANCNAGKHRCGGICPHKLSGGD